MNRLFGSSKSVLFLILILAILFVILILALVRPTASTVYVVSSPTRAPVPALSPVAGEKTYKDMTLCFVQVGAESDWRTAQTASFKETAAKLGIQRFLFPYTADGVQHLQIPGIRDCIQQGVDVIALVPVVQDGWDDVLAEAKRAGIPVIIVDRSVSAAPSLYATHIGSDMVREGKRAAAEMNKLLPQGGAILELSGYPDSLAAVGRAQGFRQALNANIQILDSQTGNFDREEAVPVMEAFLKKYKPDTDFQGIFVQNDEMGVGAIEAMKAAGVKPGDLKIVSVDGSRSGFQALVDGWFQADVEYNPLLGPQVFEIALKLINSQPVDKEIPTDETVYYSDRAAELLLTRQY